MAGNYPDAIGPRMAYDRDGTVLFNIYINSGVVQTEAEGAALNARNLNDESHGTTGASYPDTSYHWYTGFMFPQKRDLIGYFLSTRYQGAGQITVSSNSTNGQDGTWTYIQTGMTFEEFSSNPAYRTKQTLWTGGPLLGVKCLRIENFGGFIAGYPSYSDLHLFGKISAGETPHRVAHWHPTLDQSLDVTPAYLDWADIPRGSSATKQFRIKNLSPTKTANNVVVSVEALTDTTPSLPPQYAFSLDGSLYTTTVEIVSLAPGALQTVYVSRTTPNNAALGLWAQRIVAAPGTMTGAAAATGVATTSTYIPNVATFNAPLPAGTAAGDQLVMSLVGAGGDGSGNNPNTPAGWTSLDNQIGSYINGRLSSKVASATDVSNGFITVTFPSPTRGGAMLATVKGSAGIRSFVMHRDTFHSGDDTVMSAAAVAGDLALYFGGVTSDAATTFNVSRGTVRTSCADVLFTGGVASESLTAAGAVTVTLQYASTTGVPAVYDGVVIMNGGG